VEAKSFTRAADLLGVSPPVVSRAIATLEQRLGNQLFHRTTRHISAFIFISHLFHFDC
jgi:DNA-binding transcriptional LysR family regulator